MRTTSMNIYVMRDDVANEIFIPMFAVNDGTMKRDLKFQLSKNPDYPVNDFSIAYAGQFHMYSSEFECCKVRNWIKLADFLQETVKDDEQ